MPVKYFVSRDSQGREHAPDYSHETKAVIEIIKKVVAAFNHHHSLYALIVNLNEPNAYADLLLITERGVGVVELKDYYGRISQRAAIWYAGPIPIKAGSANTPARNPHEQVQAYAQKIRDDLVKAPLRKWPWLPGLNHDREAFKFSTAVCFTNERANFDYFRKHYRAWESEKAWEQFKILTPDEIPEWVAALRFEVDKGPAYRYQPYRLMPKQIMRIVRELFGATEWTEIDELMPTGEPYAYLLLKQEGQVITRFGLMSDEVIIGRSSKCDLTTPRQFTRVSGRHAKITRRVDTLAIEDLDSTNGTYINGLYLPTSHPFRLEHGSQIMLGGQIPTQKVCEVELSFYTTPTLASDKETQL